MATCEHRQLFLVELQSATGMIRSFCDVWLNASNEYPDYRHEKMFTKPLFVKRRKADKYKGVPFAKIYWFIDANYPT